MSARNDDDYGVGATSEARCLLGRLVIEELIGIAGERNAYYWRTQSGAELDLLLMLGGQRVGIEVKYADAPSMTRSMHACIERLKLDRLYVVYPGREPYALRREVEVLPLPLARDRLMTARRKRTRRVPIKPGRHYMNAVIE